MPSANAISYTASGSTLDDLVSNSILNPLATGVNYEVVLALVGNDQTTKGLSYSRSTPSSGVLTLTGNNNAIAVTIPNASWPTNYQYAGFVAVFLKQGSADAFQLAACQAIDTTNDMVIFILAAPQSTANKYTISQLNSTSTISDNSLGDRKPTGYDFFQITPTTRDITQKDTVPAQITFTPNTSADFNVATTRGFDVEFFSEANDVKTLIQAGAGDYGSKVIGGVTYKQSARAINTAQIKLPGVMPLVIIMPPDPVLGVGETMLCTSLLLQNQDELSLAWSKRNETPVRWHFQSISSEVSMIDVPTVWSYLRK